jgi:hypothetical protein
MVEQFVDRNGIFEEVADACRISPIGNERAALLV